LCRFFQGLFKSRHILLLCNNFSKVFLMRFSALLSALILAGVMSVGASISPAAATVSNSDAKEAVPTIYPCPPTMCYKAF